MSPSDELRCLRQLLRDVATAPVSSFRGLDFVTVRLPPEIWNLIQTWHVATKGDEPHHG